MHALADAAFELARERGLDGFVINEVAQRANYSPRTFANYFSCKEEAVAMAVFSFTDPRPTEDLKEDDTPLDALQCWLSMQLTADLLWKMRELKSLSKRYPTLEPFIFSVNHRLQAAAHEELSRLFQDRYSQGYIHLLVGAVFGSILPIIDGSMKILLPADSAEQTPETTSFQQYLDMTFGYLRNGF